jgi:hypothetical protein
MVVCLAASRELLRAQAMRYMSEPRDCAHGVHILDKGWDMTHTLYQL